MARELVSQDADRKAAMQAEDAASSEDEGAIAKRAEHRRVVALLFACGAE